MGNIRRGIHGSTPGHRDGLCAVVSVSHDHLGATASDLGSVGECANFTSLLRVWCQDGKCATFVVDSGASMHMISEKDLNDAELGTLTTSCSPTIVITANGEVQTHEEAILYV